MALHSNAFKTNKVSNEANDFIVYLMQEHPGAKRGDGAGGAAKPPEVPQQPSNPSDNDIRAVLAPVVGSEKILVPVHSIPVTAYAIPYNGKGKIVTNLPTFSSLGVDSQVFQAINHVPPAYADDATQKILRKQLQNASRFVATKGTLSSWIGRFKQGLMVKKVDPPWVVAAKNVPLASKKPLNDLLRMGAHVFVKKLMNTNILSITSDPWADTFKNDDYMKYSAELDYNFESSAGPYYNYRLKKDPQVMVTCQKFVDDVMFHMKHIGDATTSRYMKGDIKFDNVPQYLQYLATHDPLSMAAALTPKMELYESLNPEVLELEKTRPYYRHNYHWVKIFGPVVAEMKRRTSLFTREGGANAVGFSWAHGGASDLIRWILAVPEGEVKMAAYADDQIWVFNVKGRRYVLTPDFRQMDSSVHKETGYVFREIFNQMFPDATQMWKNVVDAMVILAFSHPLIVYKGMTYWKRDKLSTGVTGTTEMDQLTSYTFHLLMWEEWQKYYNAWSRSLKGDVPDKDCFTMVKAFVALLQEKCTWLEIKPETLTVWPLKINPDKPTFLPFKFLGFHPVVVGKNAAEEWVAVPSQEPLELVKSLVFPKVPSKLEKNDLSLTRMFQVTFNGVYLFPALYSAICLKFDALIKTVGFTPPDNNGEQQEILYTVLEEALDSYESMPSVAETFWKKNKRYPTREECMGLFCPATDGSGNHSEITFFAGLTYTASAMPTSQPGTKPVALAAFKELFKVNSNLLVETRMETQPPELVGTLKHKKPKKAKSEKKLSFAKPKVAEASKALEAKGEKRAGSAVKSWFDMAEEEELEEEQREFDEEIGLDDDFEGYDSPPPEYEDHYRDDDEVPLDRKGKKKGRGKEEESSDSSYEFET